MKTTFTEMTGAKYPLVAFNRSPEVVVEASKAGALGVLAATQYSPVELDTQLTWIEEQLEGIPYGVDLLVPKQRVVTDRARLVESLWAQIPQEHADFVSGLMEKYDIPSLAGDSQLPSPLRTEKDTVPQLLEVCFSHDIHLIANALGTPPEVMIAQAKEREIPVAALVGKRQHAERQLENGVDILVAQGYEAGGHTGEITSMVLTPEVIDLAGDVPVLMAGGIGTGRQLAAALAMGAAGGWTGSVWLSAHEDITIQTIKNKFLTATSLDTERSRTRTGKPARQLVSDWHREWGEDSAPKPLPMPLQGILTDEAWARIDIAADQGHEGAHALESYFIGQIVGSFKEIRKTKDIVASIMDECTDRLRVLSQLLSSLSA